MCEGLTDVALARAIGVVLSGVCGSLVRVEVEVSSGLPSVGVVGLPDTSVGESRWRARSALTSIGATWPLQRVTVSLAPAEVRKVGAGLDLPIAIAVLVASEQLSGIHLDSTVLLGELGLDGSLRPVRGALAGVLAAQGSDRIIVPAASLAEIGSIPAVRGAHDLAEAIAILRGEAVGASPVAHAPAQSERPDLADVRGHTQARHCLEIAAAGGHHLAMVGAPGIGKTLLAERLPGVMPDLQEESAREVAVVHSLADRPHPGVTPPFEAPHHSASVSALIGSVSGARVTPGAFVLAHHGVLFMDEAPEFARPCLEALRQPLESGVVSLHRSGWSGTLPSAFQLVVAANPCPCGMRGTPECSCPPAAIRRYAARLSGPLMDRIDLRVGLSRPRDVELRDPTPAEASSRVRERVAVARERATQRFVETPWKLNARIPTGELRRRFAPDDGGSQLLADVERQSRNLRGPDRILRVAWTVADLQGHDRPTRDDVAQALGLRGAATPWAA
jgi:magnesium chelatase family protein